MLLLYAYILLCDEAGAAVLFIFIITCYSVAYVGSCQNQE